RKRNQTSRRADLSCQGRRSTGAARHGDAGQPAGRRRGSREVSVARYTAGGSADPHVVTAAVRILYQHRTLADGAEGVHIAAMVDAFRALGHEVRVAGLAAGGTGSSGQSLAARVKES